MPHNLRYMYAPQSAVHVCPTTCGTCVPDNLPPTIQSTQSTLGLHHLTAPHHTVRNRNQHRNCPYLPVAAHAGVELHELTPVEPAEPSSEHRPLTAWNYKSYISRHIPFDLARAKVGNGLSKINLGMQMYVGWQTYINQLAVTTGSFRFQLEDIVGVSASAPAPFSLV
jgi:hypothetical protein